VNKYVLKAMVTYYDDHDLKNIVDHIQEEVCDMCVTFFLQILVIFCAMF